MKQMNKREFSDALRRELNGYPTEEVERSVSFYEEMIDDRVENGMTEEAAVASLGSVEEIAKKLREEMPITAIVRSRVQNTYEKQKKKTGGSALPWILLAVVLSPVWIPLAIAVLTVWLGILVAAVAVVAAVFCTVVGLLFAAGVFLVALIMAAGTVGPGGTLFGVGSVLVCIGLSILLFWAAIGIGKALYTGIRALFRAIKRGLSRK